MERVCMNAGITDVIYFIMRCRYGCVYVSILNFKLNNLIDWV